MDELGEEILRHIHTYHLTTVEAVSGVFGLPNGVAVDRLAKLRRDGFVESADLTGAESYFYLQHPAAQVLRVEKVRGASLKMTPKTIAYGTLRFCCLTEGKYRPRIPEDVFQKEFPELFWHGKKINFFTEGRRLGYIRVDTHANTSGHPRRVIDTARSEIDKRESRKPAFKTLTGNPLYVVHITGFEDKAERIRAEMEQMKERYRLYNQHLEFEKNGNAASAPETAKAASAAHTHWHKRNRERVTPRLPPRLEVVVIPELLNVLFPRPGLNPAETSSD